MQVFTTSYIKKKFPQTICLFSEDCSIRRTQNQNQNQKKKKTMMMMGVDEDDPDRRRRVIGDYILGPRLGTGSFAEVWRGTHRQSGITVAIKEIDKKKLNPIITSTNPIDIDGDHHPGLLFKEISILNTINHPNIIRLFDVIQTEDRIFLVMEYCDGGDLSGYLHRHGKVSESLARHFMRQLAAGLQVLDEKHLIHRDLKPQNLLLSTDGKKPILKIGDFGFARYLQPQGLADTLCGSPLYMAPEIIRNQKYDAKADLWSVGAILFQVVTGKPPFEGTTQFQLFQNILTSSELRFPKGALQDLCADCVDLCKSLLRQNPVERLSFNEFFNHKFLAEPKLPLDLKQSNLVPLIKPPTQQFEYLTDQKLPFAFDKRPQLQHEHPVNSSDSNPTSTGSSLQDDKKQKDQGSTTSVESGHEVMPNIVCKEVRKFDGVGLNSSVYDSMGSIEKDYVLVNNAHFASMGIFSSSIETSMQESSSTNVSIYPPKKNSRDIPVALQTKELSSDSLGGAVSLRSHVAYPLEASSTSIILRKVQGLSILHPSTRLQLLHQYVITLSELAQEKFNVGLFLESFSVELVVLAIWKEILRICSSWGASTSENEVPRSYSANESTPLLDKVALSSNLEGDIDFCSPSSVSMWAKQGFIRSFDHAEKLSHHLQNMDGKAEMPDAMEIIFQTALATGRSGAVDEYMENKLSAAASYATAKLLLSFIVGEATSLPLNPPFSLTPAVTERIQRYITNLELHITHSQKS